MGTTWKAIVAALSSLWDAAVAMPPRKRFRATLRASLIAIGVVAAYFASILFEEKGYLLAIIPSAIILLATLAEFVLADIITEAKYPAETEAILERLDRDLADLHGQIRERMAEAIASLNGCDQSRVSATLHLVVDVYSTITDQPKPALLQVTDYTGALGGKRWRFTEETKGLIGRCLRTRRAEWVNFANDCEYQHRMVLEFGYSAEELMQHTRQARSYWAEPIFFRERLIGVLYLFSTEPQVFPHSVDRNAFDRCAKQIGGILTVGGII